MQLPEASPLLGCAERTAFGLYSRSLRPECEEHRKIFRIINHDRKSITQCKVDGCLLKGDERRCDCLFLIGCEQLFLVELKGTGHVHALRQIISTAEALEITSFPGVKRSAIVGSPSPKAATVYQNELAKLIKRFRAVGLTPPIKKNERLEIQI